MENYGRNRESIADIEQVLVQIFHEHPESHDNKDGEPIIPADNLVDIFRAISWHYDGFQLINKDEEEQLTTLIKSNPGLEVTPHVLLQFIAMRTSHSHGPAHDHSPSPTPSSGSGGGGSNGSNGDGSEEPPVHPDNQEGEMEEDAGGDEEGETYEYEWRGRSEEWVRGEGTYSRSSSNDSAGTSVQRSRPSSRASSIQGGRTHSYSSSSSAAAAKTPNSPFDATRRQRSTPLTAAPPSSWSGKRPKPARRRKSVDSALSDTESNSAPSSFRGPSGRRSRAPSNSSQAHPGPPTPSRPHSRAQSQPQVALPGYHGPVSDPASPFEVHDDDDDEDIDNYRVRSESPEDFDERRRGGSREMFTSNMQHDDDDDDDGGLMHLSSINSLPMPRVSDDDDDPEHPDPNLIVAPPNRSAASSTASLEPSERLEALQRSNEEMTRKMKDQEVLVQMRLSEREQQIEDLQVMLDEARGELSMTKREEKELRAKERQNSTQISLLESDVARLQKAVDQARATYTSLQKQYTEQCVESERYRNTLRSRDDELKELSDSHHNLQSERNKWLRDQANYEERLHLLEADLVAAQQTYSQLDDQKQENLLLKETIDRMRFDMDELRNSQMTGGLGGSFGPGGSRPLSTVSTLSKTLGAELMKIGGEGASGEGEGDGSEASTTVEEAAEGSDETESEDVIQTIITRKKRKGMSRANKDETIRIEEVKSYSDAYTVYDPPVEFLVAAFAQTDPEPVVKTLSSSMQTEPEPVVPTSSFGAQTDPEPVIETSSASMQTEPEPVTPVSSSSMQTDSEPVTETASFSTQTDPEPVLPTASSSMQTEPEPKIPTASFSVQTDLESKPPARVTSEIEIQTEESEADTSSRASLEEDDSMASSSSTVRPATPRPESQTHDLPPSYSQVTTTQEQEEHDLRVAAETLNKWHKGVSFPFRSSAGGPVSEEAVEEWKALKEELGVECSVIDKIVADAPKTPEPRPSKDGKGHQRSKSSRFYNIYNTYVYGGKKDESDDPFSSTLAAQVLLCVGASALVFLAMRPFLAPQYVIAGGLNHYDRMAWSSFNTMFPHGEGLSTDGGAAVWNVFGRLSGGTARRVVRSWPT